MHLEIGDFRIGLAAIPKFLPKILAVAIYHPRAANGETIHSISIHKGGKIVQTLPLHA